jgi:hypothetical protein
LKTEGEKKPYSPSVKMLDMGASALAPIEVIQFDNLM